MKVEHWTIGFGRSCRSGFSLMEAVVAMAVVGILAAALYGGMLWATFSVRLARENLRATQILIEKTEVIRTFTWDQINSNGFVPTTFTAPYFSNGTTNYAASGLVYTGTVAISALPAADRNYTNDLRVIKVDLSWASGGVQRTRELITYVARYGIQNYLIN